MSDSTSSTGPQTVPSDAPTGTRADLIAAGLALFGRDGFAGTSTRALAAMAKTNIASISYHFGGKDGLRLACGAEVLRRMTSVAGTPGPVPAMPPDRAAKMLEAMLRAIVGFLALDPGARQMLGFVMRELAEDGPALDLFFTDFISPKHRQLCALVGMASGRDPASEDTKLLVFSMIGQVLYFRIGQPIVCRQLEWQDYGPAEARAIADRLVANMHAMLKVP
ncbi:CerR family C-terminal domain-containing protein [Paracoccus pacificus]|uniref:CerR family C-terminal domain-containing protein n=1 Tax=Paracoccus pacificus TaxID=1463598 RepID=A0ABW4R6K9_9RHOB